MLLKVFGSCSSRTIRDASREWKRSRHGQNRPSGDIQPPCAERLASASISAQSWGGRSAAIELHTVASCWGTPRAAAPTCRSDSGRRSGAVDSVVLVDDLGCAARLVALAAAGT